MENRGRKRMLSQRKAFLDLEVYQRNFNPAPRPRQEKHQRSDRKSEADNKHRYRELFRRLGRRIRADRRKRGPVPAEAKRIERHESGGTRKAGKDKRNPQHRSQQVPAQRGDCRRIGDIRNVEIGAEERIRKPLVRKTEQVVIHDGDKKVERIKNGQCAGSAGKGKQSAHHEDGAKGHEYLPDDFTFEHLRQRESQRIREAVEQH